MDWVFLEKFEKVGTAQGAVRAEIAADKKLVACRARLSLREDKLRATEEELLKYSRIRRECESKKVREKVEEKRRQDKIADQKMAQADTERAAEAASLEAFLRGGKAEDALEKRAQPGEADEARQRPGEAVEGGGRAAAQNVPLDHHAHITSLHPEDVESGMTPDEGSGRSVYFEDNAPGFAGEEHVGQQAIGRDYIYEPSRLEYMYRFGVLKQRMRNYEAQSCLDHLMGPDACRHLALSLRPAYECSSFIQDKLPPQGCLQWDPSPGAGHARDAEHHYARCQAIAKQNTCRYICDDTIL